MAVPPEEEEFWKHFYDDTYEAFLNFLISLGIIPYVKKYYYLKYCEEHDEQPIVSDIMLFFPHQV